MSANAGPSRAVRQIGGALSSFWEGGSGPTDQQTGAAIDISGAEMADGSNKQKRVRGTILSADDAQARLVIEELISLLREREFFTRPEFDDCVTRLRSTVAETPHVLTNEFHIDWDAHPSGQTPRQASMASASIGASATTTSPAPVPTSALAQTAPPILVSSPDRDLLCWSLKRLGMGSARPVIERQRQRSGLWVDDEYDVQDLVEMLLKSLFTDVRPEEPTATASGSHSKMDFFVPHLELGIEIKVARVASDEMKVKNELARDFVDFGKDVRVKHIVAAVYDLNGAIINAEAFENGLTGVYQTASVQVLVCQWIGPKTPPPTAKAPGVK